MNKKTTTLSEHSRWSAPAVVAKLSVTLPNDRLMRFATQMFNRHTDRQLLDIGCGAGCNAIPLATMGSTSVNPIHYV